MKSKSVKWLKNSEQYTVFKKIIFNLELGTPLSIDEIKKLIAIYIIFEEQNSFSELIRKIRVYLFLNNNMDNLFFEYIKKEGLFPLLKNYYIDYKNENSSILDIFYNELVASYTKDKIIYTYDQEEFIKKLNKSGNHTFIAPTSFGKSSAVIDKIMSNTDMKTLILVPSKLLLVQFARQIREKLNIIPVTHHEQKINSNVFILTQERLQYLMYTNPEINFDVVFVDEAHHVLGDDKRSVLLTTSLINLKSRNESVKMLYLSPFNMNVQFETNNKYSQVVNKLNISKSVKYLEKIKVKRYFIHENDQTYLYNETLKEIYKVSRDKSYSSKRIVYLNKPKDILRYIDKMRSKNHRGNSKDKNIEEIFGKGSLLFEGVSDGYYPLFGLIPIHIRQYILAKYLESKKGVLVINSAALEGVNTDAQEVHIYDYRKGKRFLKSYELDNLVGRANRLSDVVSDKNRLVTDIHFYSSEYNRKDLKSIKKYLDSNALIKEEPLKNDNILLSEEIHREEEVFIDNQIEVDYDTKIRLKTKVGRLLSLMVSDISNIEIIEEEIESNMDECGQIVTLDSKEILNCIVKVFYSEETTKDELISRLKKEEALNYYSIILNYYINNLSLKQIISQTVGHWKKKQKENIDFLVYVDKFGNLKRDGFKESWVNILNMQEGELYKYATIKTLLEVEHVELKLFPYLRILYEFEKLSDDVYNTIIYSTTNLKEIELKKMGISNELFTQLKELDLIDECFNDQKSISSIIDKIKNPILRHEFNTVLGK